MVFPDVRQGLTRRLASVCAFIVALCLPSVALARPISQGWIERNIPDWLRYQVLEIEVWQILALTLLLSVAVVIQRLTHFAIATQLRRMVYQAAPQLDKTIAHGAAPFSALVMAALVGAGFPYLGFPEQADQLAEVAVRMMAITGGVWLFLRQADVLATLMATKNLVSKPLVRLVRRTIKAVILFLGLLVALQTMDVDIGGLLAGLGIGSIGLAFAAKDTVAHIFGSLVIFLDRPFQIADWVIIEGKLEGIVEDVGFRTTRIRTFWNSLLYVPNAKLVDMAIDNMELRTWRRLRTELKINLHTPPELVQAFVEGLRAITLSHPQARKDDFVITVDEFGEYHVGILLWVMFKVPNYLSEKLARHAFILQVLSLAQDLGIEWAFPSRTVYVDSQYPHEGRRKPGHDREWTADELRVLIKSYGPGGKKANLRYDLTHGHLPLNFVLSDQISSGMKTSYDPVRTGDKQPTNPRRKPPP